MVPAQGLEGLRGTGVNAPSGLLQTVGDLFDWAAVPSGTLRDSFLVALGAPGSIQDYAFIEEDDFKEVLASYRLEVDGVQAPLNPTEKARFRAAWRGARALVGLDRPSAPAGSPSGVPAPGGGSGSAAAAVARKVKLSSLVDATAEAELVPLDSRVLRDMFAAYESTRGEPPAVDVEPSPDQLAAVHQLIESGAAPYVDFSLFGPHGRRLSRKLTFVEHSYLPSSGTWKRLELAGPPDYEAWLRSWSVLECTLLLLRQVKAERLRMYSDVIRKFHLRYGPAIWPILYQADVRMRSEEFERIRRFAEIALTRSDPADFLYSRYDPKLPWDGVFAIAVRSKEFWDEEVEKKAMLYLTRVKPQGALLSDGTAQDFPPGPPAHPGGREAAPGGGKKRKGGTARGPGRGGAPQPPAPAAKAPKRSKAGGGSAAQEICINWNSGGCADPCSHGRRHVCSECGGGHRRAACPALGKGGGSSKGSGPRKK